MKRLWLAAALFTLVIGLCALSLAHQQQQVTALLAELSRPEEV